MSVVFVIMITQSNRTYRFRRNTDSTSETTHTQVSVKKHVYKVEEKQETQASRIIEKFGNARKLAKALQQVGCPKNPTSIYRWAYPKERGGCGGIIPTAVWPFLLKAARLEGIMLDDEEISPRESVASRKKLIGIKDPHTGVTSAYEHKSSEAYRPKYRRKVIP